LWVGLAVVVTGLVSNRLLKVLVWVVAVVEPLTIGFARVYRGMHHVTDVVAGAALGVGCLLVALMSVRLVSALVEQRGHQEPHERHEHHGHDERGRLPDSTNGIAR
jgi:membrane-associated phospholipid phosphatase